MKYYTYWIFLSIFLFIVMACNSSTKPIPQDEARGRRSILNGVPASDSEYPEVEQLFIVLPKAQGFGLCTATLINPRVALTAAHCVPKESARFGTFLGTRAFHLMKDGGPFDSLGSNARSAIVTKIEIHPGFLRELPGFDPVFFFDELSNLNYPSVDLALLQLDRSYLKVTPPDIYGGPLPPTREAKLIGVGFGVNGIRDPADSTGGLSFLGDRLLGEFEFISEHPIFNGVRQRVGTILSEPKTNQNVCEGDSGGPLFIIENGVRKIAGVASLYHFTDSSTELTRCQTSLNNVHVDVSIPEIAQWIQKTAAALVLERKSFLDSAFIDLLHRAPFETEKKKKLFQGDYTRIERRRSLVREILKSSERLLSEIQTLYTRYLRREGEISGTFFWIDKRLSGVSLTEITGRFLSSDEYFNGPVCRKDPERFANRIYLDLLARLPSPMEIENVVSIVKSGDGLESGRNKAVQIILKSEEYFSFEVKNLLLHYLQTETPKSYGLRVADLVERLKGDDKKKGATMEEILVTILSSKEYLERIIPSHNPF